MRLPPELATGVLAAAAGLVVVAGTGSQLMVEATGHDHMYGLVPLLDLDEEANLPSFFSALLLLAAALPCALLAAIAAKQGSERRTGWSALALIGVLMAFDEAASLHELLIRPLRGLLGARASGVLFFPWVLPALAVLAAMAWALRPFFAQLPGQLRTRMATAALLYLGGALGMELLGARHASTHGTDDLFYRVVLVGVEEGLEMAGAIALMHALLAHLADTAPRLLVDLAARPAHLRARRPPSRPVLQRRLPASAPLSGAPAFRPARHARDSAGGPHSPCS